MASPAAAAAADGEDLEDAAPPLPMLLATDLRYPVTIVVDMMVGLGQASVFLLSKILIS